MPYCPARDALAIAAARSAPWRPLPTPARRAAPPGTANVAMLPRPLLTSVASCVVGSYCKSSLGAPNIPSANSRAASWSAWPVLVKYSPVSDAPTVDSPRPTNSVATPGSETKPRVNSRGAAPSVSRTKLGLGASIPVFVINAAWLPNAAALARARCAASRRACARSGPRSIRPGVIFA